jgi:polyhydroxybutyrate depolymerase
MLRLGGLLLIALCLAVAAGYHVKSLPSGAQDEFLVTADGARHFLVIAAGPGARPTIIVLHGRGGTAAATATEDGFAAAARRYGFNAVFPEGIDRQWTDGRFPPSTRPDDLAFLEALATNLLRDGTVAPGRLYLAGISNGGMMTLTLACKAAKLFAGYGTVIAALPKPLTACRLPATRVVMVNGTADPVVPFAGGTVHIASLTRGSVLGAEQTVRMFALAAGCTGTRSRSLPNLDSRDGTTVTRTDWLGCRPGTLVRFYRVDGGGHQVPGGTPGDEAHSGLGNDDISAAGVILEAFADPR